MLYTLINNKRELWLNSEACSVKNLISYIQNKGKLRDAQFECVKTFLFLKLYGQNKPLCQLMFEGAFNTLSLDEVSLKTSTRAYMQSHPEAQALYEYAITKNDSGQPLSPQLADLIADNPSLIDYRSTLNNLFGNVSYADYIFSIPMGAGKTWLMAMFIYLNLYFALNEPNNTVFAHNFAILAPAGLKSSIIPSLKDIKEFDPTYILPEDEALRIKRIVTYEVLEEANSSKSSNNVKNPNAVKVQAHRPFEDLMGLVLITNVEKLYDKLDKSDKVDNGVFDSLPNEVKKELMDVKLANELREIIGKLPNLCIMIDEVQHAKDEELKIVKVVNKWVTQSDFNSVLGFSGTPYFSKPETIKFNDTLKIKIDMFGNVVTYYPLANAVGNFLKRPRVKQSNISSEDIIKNGVLEFFKKYKNTVYPNVGAAKLAIYCGLIDRLEEQVYPLVSNICREQGLDPEESILRYYGNTNKSGYKCPPTAKADFRALDSVFSKHRIILLAQIGKEGWNCKSLTSVILPMPNSSAKNMVLQTCCRCLREVDSASHETALVWLSEDNYKMLDNELKKNHHSSIEQLIKAESPKREIKRYSRQDIINLPSLHYYQFNVKYNTIITKDNNVRERLSSVKLHKFLRNVITEIDFAGNTTVVGLSEIFDETEHISFNQWLGLISKESFGTISIKCLRDYSDILRKFYNKVTIKKDKDCYLNPIFKHNTLRSDIRKCFTPTSSTKCIEESIPRSASLLKIEPLNNPYFVTEGRKLMPATEAEVEKIINDDKKSDIPEKVLKAIKTLRDTGQNTAADMLFRQYSSNTDLGNNRTYHYIPYSFDSGFESKYYTRILRGMLEQFSDIEVYFNGDESLTDFNIECYSKTSNGWKRIQNYVPDFLILKRNDNGKITKVIIAETKGTPYEDAFKQKKYFMDKFISINRDANNETQFDFLYLPEHLEEAELYEETRNRIESFLNS